MKKIFIISALITIITLIIKRLLGKKEEPKTIANVEEEMISVIHELEEKKETKIKKTPAKKPATKKETPKAPAKKPATKKEPVKKPATKKAAVKKPAAKTVKLNPKK